MEVIFEACAGLDVHKQTVVACRLVKGHRPQTRTFGTTTRELLELSDWLAEVGVTHVGLESTGEYWKPVFNILEGSVEVWLLNAQHIKAVPGRKTDVRDAEWIADLLWHGLVRPSFIPPKAQRQLRELVRHRTNFIRERATLVNRVQKVLEGANIKLASVATDVMGVSGRAMLAAMAGGETDAESLSELARGKLRNKREQLQAALCGRVEAHHRFILSQLLVQIDSLEETIRCFDEQIEQACEPDEELVELLDTIPGVGREMAQIILCEIGKDMDRFPTAGHLASWAGLCPGNDESAGKRRSGRTRHGNQWLRTALVQAAQAAARKRGCYLQTLYKRLAARRGKKKAVVAVAHSILVSAYHIISRREPYRELGPEHFDERRRSHTAHRLTQRLRTLGFHVIIEPREDSVPQGAAIAPFSS